MPRIKHFLLDNTKHTEAITFLGLNMNRLMTAALLFLASATARADLQSDAGMLTGYTIVGKMTITGWYDTDSEKKSGQSFEGCNFNRVLVFDNTKVLTCAGYGYQYAYRPDALILVKGGSFVMYVEGTRYDMRR